MHPPNGQHPRDLGSWPSKHRGSAHRCPGSLAFSAAGPGGSGKRARVISTRSAKPHPYCRPLHERARGQAGGASGEYARSECRRRASPALWQASPHPPCQAASLPPPSPPIRIPAAPSRAGPRAGGRGQRQSSSTGMQATSDARLPWQGARFSRRYQYFRLALGFLK